MIVKNNYFWGAEYDKVDFIANGDIATVEKVGKYKDLYGFHFVKNTLEHLRLRGRNHGMGYAGYVDNRTTGFELRGLSAVVYGCRGGLLGHCFQAEAFQKNTRERVL